VKTELYSHRNPKGKTKMENPNKPDKLDSLIEDYAWKLFPLMFLILLLLIPRFTAWVLGYVFTFLGEGCVKFLKVTEI
jgi:hypothetical protein